MIQSDNPDHKATIENIYKAKQEHIFKFWDELDSSQKDSLIEQAATIDFELIEKLVYEHIHTETKETSKPKLEPTEVIAIPKTEEEKEKQQKAKELGEKALNDKKVGVFLVAGGQGSRLGYDGPKGCFKISNVKNKSIFQLHAEKILAMEKRYSTTLPWYIMTSKENHEQTIDFFEKHDYFGLNKENISFFRQAMIPAVNKDGKLILANKDKIFMNPDGHGGAISALKESGSLKDIKSRGLDYLFYFQVDNILVKMADPVFIGYHILEKAEMSSKIVEKVSAEEKVGVIGKSDGKLSVIEYSVLPKELAEAKDGDKLKFWAGSIAIHVMSTDFIDNMTMDAFSLPYYKAHKAISYIDEDGNLVDSDEPNAIKFEKFIFDALKKTNNSATMEVAREKEFAPVKNKEGADSVETAKKLSLDYDISMLDEAGIQVPKNVNIEISALYALDSEELKQKVNNLELIPDSELYLGD